TLARQTGQSPATGNLDIVGMRPDGNHVQLHGARVGHGLHSPWPRNRREAQPHARVSPRSITRASDLRQSTDPHYRVRPARLACRPLPPGIMKGKGQASKPTISPCFPRGSRMDLADTEPDAPAMRCMEIRGGSRAVAEAFTTPGLDAWLCSRPFEGAEHGG